MKPDPERLAMADSQPVPPRRQGKAKNTWRERALVLGPFVFCVVSCVIYAVLFRFPAPGSAGAAFLALAMGASVLWIVVAGLALALDRGIRHADWSFFRHQDQAPGDGAGTDWDTRTGSFAWMRDWEDLQSGNDDHHP